MNPVSIFNIESVRSNIRVVPNGAAVKSLCRIAALAAVILLPSLSLEAQTARQWFEKGLDAFRRQNIGDALEYFSRAAESDPANPDYPFYKAICHHSAGRLEEADAAYTLSLDLGGDPDLVLMRRGNLRWSKEDIPGALADYTKVIDGDGPSAAAALRNRANLELSEGMYESAAEDYAAYLLAEPEAPDREAIERVAELLDGEIEAARIAEAERLALETQHRRTLIADSPEPPGAASESAGKRRGSYYSPPVVSDEPGG